MNNVKEFYVALAMLALATLSACTTPTHIKHACVEPDAMPMEYAINEINNR